jgi:hypothetical protein
MLTLHGIANALGGKPKGNRVICPGPEAAYKKKAWQRKRKTLAVWITPDGEDIRVHSHHPDGGDYRQIKDWVRQQLGIEWKPRQQNRRQRRIPPFKRRNPFFAETLSMCRYRGSITVEQFNLLINDLRPPSGFDKAEIAKTYYMVEFGFDLETVKRALELPHRTYTADERAKIFNLTYAERQLLGLRRTGSIDVDKEGRERARRDRYNAKRKAQRAKARELVKTSVRSHGVNRVIPSLDRHIGESIRLSIVAELPHKTPDSGLGGDLWPRQHQTGIKIAPEPRTVMRCSAGVRPKYVESPHGRPRIRFCMAMSDGTYAGNLKPH